MAGFSKQKDNPSNLKYIDAAKTVFPISNEMEINEALLIIENRLRHNIRIFLDNNIEKRNEIFANYHQKSPHLKNKQ